MPIKLRKDAERYLLGSIKRFMAENIDEEIGDLKASLLLEFCLREIGPSIYNQAMADAQQYIQDKAADLKYASLFYYFAPGTVIDGGHLDPKALLVYAGMTPAGLRT